MKGGAIDAEDAIRRYYVKQCRRPKFHGKNARKRFRADNGAGTVQVDGNRLALPAKMGGAVKMLEPLRWPSKAVRECRISLRAGRWHASVRLEISDGEYGKGHGEGRAGMDLGMEALATIAWPDGSIEKVECASNRYSRRRWPPCAAPTASWPGGRRGGRNWQKAKTELQRKHGRMANIREDFLHKLSDRLTANCRTLTVESLSHQGLATPLGPQDGRPGPWRAAAATGVQGQLARQRVRPGGMALSQQPDMPRLRRAWPQAGLEGAGVGLSGLRNQAGPRRERRREPERLRPGAAGRLPTEPV